MRKIFYILFFVLTANLFAQKSNETESVVSLTARAITPIGIFSENWNTGGGIYLSYGWVYSEEWGVQFQTGYNRYRIKPESQFTESPKLSMWAFQIGGRHYFLRENVKPFVTVLSGVNIIRLIYKTEDVKVDERDIHLNFQMGGGVTYRVMNNLEIELSVLYNSHLINPSIPYNLTGFEYGVGLNWIL
ncbi:MAG: porin family protein [Melioribacteraceae bacterium]|nr:porin family protein [Melioribacteraceae bacterium]